MKYVHDKEKIFACEVCGESQLNHHRKTHDPNANLPYHCEFSGCGEKFTRKFELKQHMRKTHPESFTHACQIPGCNEKLSKLGGLTIHIQKVHKKVKNYALDNRSVTKKKFDNASENSGANSKTTSYL